MATWPLPRAMSKRASARNTCLTGGGPGDGTPTRISPTPHVFGHPRPEKEFSVSLRQLRSRLFRDESGMGIVEILVAMMIFAIVTIGMSYSMISMTRLTADASARE